MVNTLLNDNKSESLKIILVACATFLIVFICDLACFDLSSEINLAGFLLATDNSMRTISFGNYHMIVLYLAMSTLRRLLPCWRSASRQQSITPTIPVCSIYYEFPLN